jgi:hypothetical protein
MKCELGIAGVKAAWSVIALGQHIVRTAERMEERVGEAYTVRCNFAWRLMTVGERVGTIGEALEARVSLWAQRAGCDMDLVLARLA